jgi:hypothetical protein
VKPWTWLIAGIALIALGVAFLIPVWIAWPGGLLLVVVGLARWPRDRKHADDIP